MLQDSMRNAAKNVAAEDAARRAREQAVVSQRELAVYNLKHHLDLAVYACYGQICDAVAAACVRNPSSGSVTGCIAPNIPSPLFLEFDSRLRSKQDDEGFKTAISLSQAEYILDGRASGVDMLFENSSETQRKGLVLHTERRDFPLVNLLGNTEIKAFTLTRAGELVADEIVRQGRNEGISIVPGALFTLRAWRKKERAGQETFVPLRQGHANCKYNTDYGLDTALAFEYTYRK